MKKLISQYTGLRKEIYILSLCQLIDSAGSMIGPMFTLILSTKMGMNAGQIATYFLVVMLLSLPINLLGGKLTDRFNKKLLINICDITTSVIYIFCGIVGLNKYTLALYVAGGLLQSIESPAYTSLVADFTSSNDRDRAYSLGYLGMNVGFVLAPTLGGILIKNHVSLMFVLNGVFQLFSIIVFDIFVKGTAPVQASDNKYEEGVSGGNVFKVIKDSKILLPFMLILSLSMLVYNMYGYLIPLELSAFHGENGSVLFGTVSSLNGITVLAFTALLTALFAKRSTLDKMIFGNTCELVGLAMFWIFVGTPFIYYIAIVIFTIGEILNTISSTPHLTKRIPVNYRGRMLAVSSVVSNIIVSAGQFAIGKVYDNVGSFAAWAIVIGVGVFTIAGYLVMRKSDMKRYPELYKE